MPPSRNPFASVDKASVLGALAAAGSWDPDQLEAARSAMLAGVRAARMTGTMALLAGGAAALTRAGLWLAVPLIAVGVWLWRAALRNRATVEEGFAEFGTLRR